MKKLLGAGVLALALAVASQQEASAWTNIRFGAGVNLNWQAANNSFLWGAYRDGQIPGYPTDVKRYKNGYNYPSAGAGYGVPDFGAPPSAPLPAPGPALIEPPHGPTSDAEPVTYAIQPAFYTTPSYYQPAYDYSAPQSYPYGR